MNSTAIIFVVIFVIVGLAFRYFVNVAVNKGADAISKARVKRKNEQNPAEPTKLSNLYDDHKQD